MLAIAAKAASGATPHNDAAAAAMAALPTLTSPGSASGTSYAEPPVRTVRPPTVHVGSGRASPQASQRHERSRMSTAPHCGHEVESSVHRWPAETHTASVPV